MTALALMGESADAGKWASLARAHHAMNGDLRVSAKFVTDDGFRLGMWLVHRRALRRRGALPVDKVAQLDELGMIWDARAMGASQP